MIAQELTSLPLCHGAPEELLEWQAGVRLAPLPRASLWQRPVTHVLGVCEQLQDSRPEIKQGEREEVIISGQMKKLHFMIPNLALLATHNE